MSAHSPRDSFARALTHRLECLCMSSSYTQTAPFSELLPPSLSSSCSSPRPPLLLAHSFPLSPPPLSLSLSLEVEAERVANITGRGDGRFPPSAPEQQSRGEPWQQGATQSQQPRNTVDSKSRKTLPHDTGERPTTVQGCRRHLVMCL